MASECSFSFDEDYFTYIKSQQKMGELDVDEREAIQDMHRRVDFEIDNMFRLNDRICYGHPSTYIPVLFQEVMYGYVDKLLLTKQKINNCVEEVKQKMKLQIQKARNNSREFFLIDYENWIKSEANGAMKVNKVAREMLATYVPFCKRVRDKLKAQKTHENAFTRFEREKIKKIQEMENVMRLFPKNNKDVPGEIKECYEFYVNH